MNSRRNAFLFVNRKVLAKTEKNLMVNLSVAGLLLDDPRRLEVEVRRGEREGRVRGLNEMEIFQINLSNQICINSI